MSRTLQCRNIFQVLHCTIRQTKCFQNPLKLTNTRNSNSPNPINIKQPSSPSHPKIQTKPSQQPDQFYNLFFPIPPKAHQRAVGLNIRQSSLCGFKLNSSPTISIIIQMHRYGLVYLWHNRQLENQNRSLTKERRDGQPPTPRRNRNRIFGASNQALSNHTKSIQSIQSDLPNTQINDIDDIADIESQEVKRARVEVEKARKVVEKVEGEKAEAKKRVSEMAAVSIGAGCEFSNAQIYNHALQLARRESERLQKDRVSAIEELQSKQQILARLQYRKCSM